MFGSISPGAQPFPRAQRERDLRYQGMDLELLFGLMFLEDFGSLLCFFVGLYGVIDGFSIGEWVYIGCVVRFSDWFVDGFCGFILGMVVGV